MSQNEKGFFRILEQKTESNYKIQENIPNSEAESIEIVQSGPAKTQDGKSATLFKTTQGRQFARLDEWPNDILLELPKR